MNSLPADDLDAAIGARHFKLVGILGGMGPAATVDLMQKVIDLTAASCDQEHVPMIVWNVPQIPDRNAYIAGEGASPVEAMCAGARVVANAGAEAIVVACNTAHHWADEISAVTNLPQIHIADAALAELQRRKSTGKIMLIATNGTHKLGIYTKRAKKYGITLQMPDTTTQAKITAIITLVKAGKLANAQAALVPVLTSMLAQGNNTFLLGCTEIPLMVKGTIFEAKSVDATAALAAEIVRFSISSLPLKTPERNTNFGDQMA